MMAPYFIIYLTRDVKTFFLLDNVVTCMLRLRNPKAELAYLMVFVIYMSLIQIRIKNNRNGSRNTHAISIFKDLNVSKNMSCPHLII